MFSSEQQKYIEMIAKYCQLPPAKVNLDELRSLYDNSHSPDPILMRKYLGPNISYGKKAMERYGMLNHRIEGLFDLPNRFFSYGTFTPSYLTLLKDSPVSATLHHGLLVGALTLDTIYEFRAVMTLLFPEADLTVLDFEAYETCEVPPEVAKFEFGNALKLKFEDKFDSIHTNYLTSTMADPSTGNFAMPYDIPYFYEGAFTALRVGGRLVMVEATDEVEYGWEDYCKELTQIGFIDVQLRPTIAFEKRRSVFEFTENPTLDLSNFPVVDKSTGSQSDHTSRAICATKPR